MGEMLAEFVVLGEAKTAGSKRGFVHPHVPGKVIITDDTGKAGRLWRQDVQAAAAPHFLVPFDGAVEMEILFVRPRPRSHFGSGRNAQELKATAPAFPITRPDCDKLSRAVLDALKGIAWRDDAQVVTKTVAKRFGVADRTRVRIYRASPPTADAAERVSESLRSQSPLFVG